MSGVVYALGFAVVLVPFLRLWDPNRVPSLIPLTVLSMPNCITLQETHITGNRQCTRDYRHERIRERGKHVSKWIPRLVEDTAQAVQIVCHKPNDSELHNR